MTKFEQYRELAKANSGTVQLKWPEGTINTEPLCDAIIDLLNRLEIAEKALEYYADVRITGDPTAPYRIRAKEALSKIRGDE